MHKVDLNLQDQIVVGNATQRTISIVGGKGTGKTTTIMMLMRELEPVLVFDPLNVVKAKDIDAIRIVLRTGDIDEKRIMAVMKVVNATLRKKKNVVLAFNDMVQEEEIQIANMVLPLLAVKNAFVFFDEIHEFVPLNSGSTEVERFVRHCRNKNIGNVLTTQRPASVSKNVLALTDYLVIYRLTWSRDLEAVRDLLKDVLPKEQVNSILAKLPRLDFMEGYVIDYRVGEGKQV